MPDLKGYDISKHFRTFVFISYSILLNIERHIHTIITGEVNEFLIQVRKEGGKVLVHCRAGQSRSATLVIAHLMMFRKWSLLKTYCHVKECRPVIKPNPGFFEHLRALEREINGGKRNTMEVSDLSHGYANEMLATTPVDHDIEFFDGSRDTSSSNRNFSIGVGPTGPRSRRAAERSARRRRSKRFVMKEKQKKEQASSNEDNKFVFGMKRKVFSNSTPAKTI